MTKPNDLYVKNLVIKANPTDFYRYIYSQKKDTQGIPPLKRRNGSGLTESGARFTELFKLKIFVGSIQFVWNFRNS